MQKYFSPKRLTGEEKQLCNIFVLGVSEGCYISNVTFLLQKIVPCLGTAAFIAEVYFLQRLRQVEKDCMGILVEMFLFSTVEPFCVKWPQHHHLPAPS